jgi:hypothetical protein
MSAPGLLPLELQLLAGVSLCSLLAWVIQLIRRRELGLRESLLWLTSTGAALVLVAFPGLLARLASAAGVKVASNALFAAAFLYVLVNLLSTTIATSRNASHARRLSQECAILRAELEQLREGSSREKGPGPT